MKLIHLVLLTSFLSCLSGQDNQKSMEYQDLRCLDGSLLSSELLKNKILVVNLWASWCKPCVKEIPDLNQLVSKNRNNENVMFLAIAPSERDNRLNLSDFLERVPFLFKHIAKESAQVFYPENAELRFPTTLVFDSRGILRKKYVGTLTKRELISLDKLCQSEVGFKKRNK